MTKNRKLTHVDARGAARMVDVSGKPRTRRRAVATAVVELGEPAFRALANRTVEKGDAVAVAKVAGVMAAKRTSDLIPLCHGLSPDHVQVDIALEAPGLARIRAEAIITAATGVEMEALVAVSVAALTLYDMCKAISHEITIGPIRLEEKVGGRSNFRRRGA